MIKIEKVSTHGFYLATYPRGKNRDRGSIYASTKDIRLAVCPGTIGRIPTKMIKRYFRERVRTSLDASSYYRRQNDLSMPTGAPGYPQNSPEWGKVGSDETRLIRPRQAYFKGAIMENELSMEDQSEINAAEFRAAELKKISDPVVDAPTDDRII